MPDKELKVLIDASPRYKNINAYDKQMKPLQHEHKEEVMKKLDLKKGKAHPVHRMVTLASMKQIPKCGVISRRERITVWGAIKNSNISFPIFRSAIIRSDYNISDRLALTINLIFTIIGISLLTYGKTSQNGMKIPYSHE